MSKIKLNYFNGRGLAETSRLILAVSQQEYTDFRYPLEILCWKNYNFVKEEFEQDKKEGKLTKSLDKVPFLTVDNEVICQSKTIERYLARRYNLFGDNNIQAAQIDSICEWIRDYKQDYQKVRQLPDEEKEAGMTTWFTETLPANLGKLEAIVGETYAIGQRLSLADITIYSFITQFFDNHDAAYQATAETSHIRSVVDHVGNLNTIKDWLKKRPDTPF